MRHSILAAALAILILAAGCGGEADPPAGAPAEAPSPGFSGYMLRDGRRFDLRDGFAVWDPPTGRLSLCLSDGSWSPETRESMHWDAIVNETEGPLRRLPYVELSIDPDVSGAERAWHAAIWVPGEPPLNLSSQSSEVRPRELSVTGTFETGGRVGVRFLLESDDDGWEITVRGLPLHVAMPKRTGVGPDDAKLLGGLSTSNALADLLAKMPSDLEPERAAAWFADNGRSLGGKTGRAIASVRSVVVVPDPEWKTFRVELGLSGNLGFDLQLASRGETPVVVRAMSFGIDLDGLTREEAAEYDELQGERILVGFTFQALDGVPPGLGAGSGPNLDLEGFRLTNLRPHLARWPGSPRSPR